MLKLWLLALFCGFNWYSYPDAKAVIKDSKDAENYLCMMSTRWLDKCRADEFVSPMIFCKRGRGDCDDFARFVYEVLGDLGYEVELYVCGRKQKGPNKYHAVCVYRKDGDIGVFSNYQRFKGFTILDYIKYAGYGSAKYKKI